MEPLNERDHELWAAARAVIRATYDAEHEWQTVGAALRCANGRIYTGVNLDAIHSVCAEQTAFGAAVTAGEHEFETIVAVCGRDGETLLSPCGTCRQMMADHAPDLRVIVPTEHGSAVVSVPELLPFAYITPQKGE